jgi:hypothetical protein
LSVAVQARPLTTNLDFEPARETWHRVPAALVPTKPVVTQEAALSGSSAEPFSMTESTPPTSTGKLVARRPLLFPTGQAPESPEDFLVLQDWEGAVDSIGPQTFTARLRDRTNKDGYASEIAELPIADISGDDRELLRPGAIFYMTVGRATRASGRQDRVGRIMFRRLPAWTESTLRRAQQRAERLRRFLVPQN